jgi:hypothetical protein
MGSIHGLATGLIFISSIVSYRHANHGIFLDCVRRLNPQTEHQQTSRKTSGLSLPAAHVEHYAVESRLITCIPMRRVFVYLFAVVNWAGRRALSWRLSNTLTNDFCIGAVQEAINRYALV